MDICASIKKEPHHLRGAKECCIVQSNAVVCVDVRASVEKETDGSQVPAKSGLPERTTVLRIDVCSPSQEEIEHLNICAANSFMESVIAQCVNVGAMI